MKAREYWHTGATARFFPLLLAVAVALTLCPVSDAAGDSGDELEHRFVAPLDSARPWVLWFWINGNVSKEGITADLEAMKKVGIRGLIWMEVSGHRWAPDGPARPGSAQWHDCMQWAVRECERLGMESGMAVNCGYGSGGLHITPETSMHKLYWRETEVEGGRMIEVDVERPDIEKNYLTRLRPEAEFPAKVREQVEKIDSYKDVAVLAVPLPASPVIRGLGALSGLSANAPGALPQGAATPQDHVIDWTGKHTWDAPPGKWLLIRFGHGSNFVMTRPAPLESVGLECDRLAKAGIETHYEGFLKKVFTDAGAAARQDAESRPR